MSATKPRDCQVHRSPSFWRSSLLEQITYNVEWRRLNQLVDKQTGDVSGRDTEDTYTVNLATFLFRIQNFRSVVVREPIHLASVRTIGLTHGCRHQTYFSASLNPSSVVGTQSSHRPRPPRPQSIMAQTCVVALCAPIVPWCFMSARARMHHHARTEYVQVLPCLLSSSMFGNTALLGTICVPRPSGRST